VQQRIDALEAERARARIEEFDVVAPEDDFEDFQARALQRPLPMEVPRRRVRRLSVAHCFSLHADTAVHGNDRHGLERPCRYGTREPLSQSRLRRLEDGRYEFSPKKGTPFTVTAEALVKRLVALTPPARSHLTTFHGVYAPNAARHRVAANAGTGAIDTAAEIGLGDAAPAHRKAPTSCSVRAEAAAPSVASTPPAAPPRRGFGSWVSPSRHASCRRPPRRLNWCWTRSPSALAGPPSPGLRSTPRCRLPLGQPGGLQG
jgi:hypothetical protein